MDIADQKAFAHWEVQLVSRAPQNYDFDTRDPALRHVLKEEVRSQVTFFSDSVSPERLGTWLLYLALIFSKNIIEQDDSLRSEVDELDSFDECGYEESRHASIINDSSHSWWPSNPKGWRSLTEQLTRFHKSFEGNRHHDDVVEGPIRPNQSFVRSDNGSIQVDDYEILYNLLVHEAVCKATKHSALLRLQSLDQSSETLDIYLSCFPREPIQNHRTSIRIKRSAIWNGSIQFLTDLTDRNPGLSKYETSPRGINGTRIWISVKKSAPSTNTDVDVYIWCLMTTVSSPDKTLGETKSCHPHLGLGHVFVCPMFSSLILSRQKIWT